MLFQTPKDPFHLESRTKGNIKSWMSNRTNITNTEVQLFCSDSRTCMRKKKRLQSNFNPATECLEELEDPQ